MTSSELRFDEKIVDVSLAEAYLKQNYEFHSKSCPDYANVIDYIDNYKNKKHLTQNVSSISEIGNKSMKFMNLARKINENVKLFCQLEYLIRKKPIDETRNIDLKLLTQNLIYHSFHKEADKTCISVIQMVDATPLAVLGCVAETNLSTISIVTTMETVVICRLFQQLCRESGLQDFVRLTSVRTDVPSVNFLKIEEFTSGGVAVVTEKADIDSAVDCFLYANNGYLWHIKKIYVQECIVSSFLKSLEWKTKKPASTSEDYILKSTSVYMYDNKMFLFEYVGDGNKLSRNAITIEAYRTNKELISLLSARRNLFLSLWTNGLPESNELAFNIDTNIVWINDFACFEGPPATSQAFFSVIHKHLNEIKKEDCNKEILTEMNKALKKRDAWLKSDITERYLKVSNVIESLSANVKDFEMTNEFNNQYSSVNVNNKVCLVVRTPGTVFVKVETYKDVLRYVNYMIEGGTVVFLFDGVNDVILKSVRALSEFAPVGFISNFKSDVASFSQLQYNTKVIWSSMGTIFAN